MATHKASAARWMGMALGAVLAACGSGAGGGGTLSEDRERSGGGGGGGSTEGAALYEANCMGCHGALASSDVRGESAGDIAEAIADDEGGMGSIVLTMAQLETIAAALGGSGGDGGDEDEEDDDDDDEDDDDDGSDLVMALRASHVVNPR